jgi:hypothetical protein
VGSLSGAAADLDALAVHAAGAGLAGEDPAGVARSVWLAHKDSRGAALLHALVAAGKGDPALRGEVDAAIRAARSTQPRAQRLERALADATRLADLIREGDQLKDAAEVRTLARRLTDSIPALAREPGLSRSPTLVLDPLGPAAREYMKHVLVAETIESDCRKEIVALLDAVDDQLTPYLFLIREVYRIANDPSRSEPEIRAPIERLDAAGREIADHDPLIAAMAFQGVTAQLADQRWSAHSRETVERIHDVGERIRALAAEFTRRTPQPTEAELKFRDQALRRASTSEASVHEVLMSEAKDEATRLAEQRKAVTARRRVLAISAQGGLFFGSVGAKDARRLLEHLLVLGELDAKEPAIDLVPLPLRDALRLEALRLHDPGEALGRATIVPLRTPEIEAVRARAAADLGFKDEARSSLEKLSRMEGSTYDWFGQPRVQAYVAAKLR